MLDDDTDGAAAPAVDDGAAVLAEAAVVAAPEDVAVADTAVAGVTVAVGVAVVDCTPITCSSDCRRLPNRFCAAPGGACPAVPLLESSVDSTCEPRLWPCGCTLTGGSADGAELKFA